MARANETNVELAYYVDNNELNDEVGRPKSKQSSKNIDIQKETGTPGKIDPVHKRFLNEVFPIKK